MRIADYVFAVDGWMIARYQALSNRITAGREITCYWLAAQCYMINILTAAGIWALNPNPPHYLITVVGVLVSSYLAFLCYKAHSNARQQTQFVVIGKSLYFTAFRSLMFVAFLCFEVYQPFVKHFIWMQPFTVFSAVRLLNGVIFISALYLQSCEVPPPPSVRHARFGVRA